MIDAATYTAKETLRNGLDVTVRALRADDRARIVKAFQGLERESIYMRLFAYRDELTEAALDRIMRFDPEREAALVVTLGAGADEAIVATGRYVDCGTVEGRRTAEIAFMVEEDYAGLGIASRLLRHLAAIARGQGIGVFEADVLSENKAMLAVFARSGLKMARRLDGSTTHVTLDLGSAGLPA